LLSVERIQCKTTAYHTGNPELKRLAGTGEAAIAMLRTSHLQEGTNRKVGLEDIDLLVKA